MTKEEAIEYLVGMDIESLADGLNEAVTMAIEALSAKTDLISRAEAIEAFDRGRLYHKSGIEEIINTLPSADTKRVLQGYCKGANCKWWNPQVNGCNRCVMIQDEYKHTSADRQKGEVEEDDE